MDGTFVGERIFSGDPKYMIIEILVNEALNPVARQYP